MNKFHKNNLALVNGNISGRVSWTYISRAYKYGSSASDNIRQCTLPVLLSVNQPTIKRLYLGIVQRIKYRKET